MVIQSLHTSDKIDKNQNFPVIRFGTTLLRGPQVPTKLSVPIHEKIAEYLILQRNNNTRIVD